MDINTIIGPIGTASKDVEAIVIKLKAEWDQKVKPKAIDLIKFLVYCIDELIVFADNLLISNPDKKASVLAAITECYIYAASAILPLYLKPFSSTIENFFLSVIMPVIVDWIVEKAHSATTTPVPTTSSSNQ